MRGAAIVITGELYKLGKEEGTVGHDDKCGGLEEVIVSELGEFHELNLRQVKEIVMRRWEGG